MSTYTNAWIQYAPYTDSTGVALAQGRLQFNIAGTNTHKNVYSDPACTTSIGYALQLNSAGLLDLSTYGWYYLTSGDYDVMLQKYVSGDPLQDSSWVNVWPVAMRVAGATSTSTGGSGTFGVVNNRAAVQALPANHGLTAVLVLGYNTAGDLGGGLFYWNSASTATPTLGDIIQLNVGGTGRFILNLEPNQTYVDAAVWDVIPGAFSPIATADTALGQARSYASSNALRLRFNAPINIYLASGITFSCATEIENGVVFLSSNTTNKTITFSGNANIKSMSPLSGDVYTILGFLQSCEIPFIRMDWYYQGAGAAAAFNQATGSSYGFQIRLSHAASYNIVTTANLGNLFFENGAKITINSTSQTVTANSIDMEPNNSSNGSWKAITVTSGIFTISQAQTKPVDARWFGWDYTTGDQSAAINAAYAACAVNNLCLRIPQVQNTTLSGIGSAVDLSTANVKIIIEGMITVLTGGTLKISGFDEGRRQIFNCLDATNIGQVTCYCVTIIPEWFGCLTTATDNAIPLLRTFLAATNASLYNYAWVDGGGRTYPTLSTITLSYCTWLGVRALNIVQNGTTGTIPCLTFVSCSSMKFVDCSFWMSSNIIGAASVILGTINGTGWIFENCRFLISNQTGMASVFDFSSSFFTHIKLIRCTIVPYSASSSNTYGILRNDTDASDIELIDCDITLNGTSSILASNFRARNCTWNYVSLSAQSILMVGAVSNGSTGYNFDNNQFNNYIINLRDKVDTKFTNNTFYGSQTLNQIVLWPYGVGVAKTLIVENNHLNATDGALAWVSIVPFVNYVNGSGNFGESATPWQIGNAFTPLSMSGLRVRFNTISGITCNEMLLSTWNQSGHMWPKAYKTQSSGNALFPLLYITAVQAYAVDDLFIGDVVTSASIQGQQAQYTLVTVNQNISKAGSSLGVYGNGVGATNGAAYFAAASSVGS